MLARGCRMQQLAPGELLCREGAPGDSMFILHSGELEVFSSLQRAEVLFHRISTRGDHVGEQVLQEGIRLRSASVRAATPAIVVTLHRKLYQKALALDPTIGDVVAAQRKHQTRERQLSELSIMYRAMAGFDEEGFSEDIHIEAGVPVFEQGDSGETVYFILRGSARVLQVDEHGKTTLDVLLHPGQVFGELAVMKNTTRSATVLAEEALELISFRRERFLSAVAESPDLYQYMMALRRVYDIRDRRVLQFDGEFQDESAIVTVLQIDSTHQVVARLMVASQRYTACRH